MLELLPIFMFVCICACLMLGYPVAFTLAGVSLLFAGVGILLGLFQLGNLLSYVENVYGIMTNTALIAIPLFIFMGVTLERTKIAENLLSNLSYVCARLPAGMGISVVLVGALMAASTGIVGATVVTMGLMSLPAMLKQKYQPALACGTICATGTLGQIIPPSIALVLLGDVLSSAYQQSQLKLGIFNAAPVSVGDLFVGAIIPGLILVIMYCLYLLAIGIFKPELAPRYNKTNEHTQHTPTTFSLIFSIAPPLLLMVMVLGSIIAGIATPTEASAVGAFAALILAAIKQKISFTMLFETCKNTAGITSMIFAILLGSALFSLVFKLLGGDTLIIGFFETLPGGTSMAILVVMVAIFLLGFILDFIEITFVVVPIVAPALLLLGVDPIWLGIMIALNLQTSFLTPPFGFALFYLRRVAPPEVPTSAIYKGVSVFIVLQVLLMAGLAIWPSAVTWLPSRF